MAVDMGKLTVGPGATMREALAGINAGTKGIALVVDDDGRLVGTVTDGDIRRAVLDGLDLDGPVSEISLRKKSGPYPEPLTAPLDASRAQLLEMMQQSWIFQIPLLDDRGRVAGLATIHDLLHGDCGLEAVIMAGGLGMRLRPLTENLPKPMLPVGDRPLMEHIIDNLRRSGISRVRVASHYKAELIAEHFGDGADFGVDINYVREDQPLGTAGGLGLMPGGRTPLLVINGDILTSLNFRAMLDYHRDNRADLTVAVRPYEFEIPFGVVESDGPLLTGIREKPRLSYFVNAGIYLLEPSVPALIPRGERLDMPDLIDLLLESGRTVASFPVHEYWRDIGHHDDYRQAQEDVANGSYCP